MDGLACPSRVLTNGDDQPDGGRRSTPNCCRLSAHRTGRGLTSAKRSIGSADIAAIVDRTAIRLSPGTTMWGIDEGAEGPDLYRYLVAELDKLGLAYVQIMHQGNEPLLADVRKLWHHSLILNRPGRPRDQIGADVASGLADLEAYGQMVLANSDFVVRLKAGAASNQPDRTTYFGGAVQGYIDYPVLSARTDISS